MRGDIVSKTTLDLFLKMTTGPNVKDNFMYANVTYLAGGFGNGGFGKEAGVFDVPKGADCIGWGGLGGSTVVRCLIGTHNVTLSYVPNGLSPRFKLDRGMKLLSQAVGILLEEGLD